ncbi:MAG: hypothetical protein JSV21_06250 [Nitrospirota bacterium]|nr:MAG: hypothetical protein JSV21_06250 [Nitrospirota bacterium]
MGFWDSIKKDIKKGIDEGIHVVKEGTATFMEKAEHFAVEGKKKIREFETKQKIQVQLTELGGRIYDLMERKVATPLSHASVKPIIKKIDSLKEQLEKIETKLEDKAKKGTAKKKAKKKTSSKAKKKSTAKKKAVKKTS